MRTPLVSLLGITLIALAASASAQTHHQLVGSPIPTHFPQTMSDLTFGERGAMAMMGGGSIWVASDLPPEGSWNLLEIAPPPPLAIGSDWKRLGEDSAIYASTSGELVLVRDLPATPTLVATGLMMSLLDYRPVNDTTAVFCDTTTSQFHVLRHGPWGATSHVLASPRTLTPGHRFVGGPSGDDRFLAAGGQMSREMVVLRDLSGPPSGWSFQVVGMASGPPLQGFVVTAAGTGVGWHTESDATYVLNSLRPSSSGSGFSGQLRSVAPPGFGFPAHPRAVKPAYGDDLVLEWNEETIILSSTFVIDVGSGTHPVRSWYDVQPPWVDIGYPVAPRELVISRDDYNGTFYRYTPPIPSFGGSPVEHAIFLLIPGWSPCHVAKINGDTLVISSLSPHGAELTTIYTDLDGAAIPQTFPMFSGSRMQFTPLSSGLLGAWSTPGASVPPALHVLTAPAAYAVGEGQSLGPAPGLLLLQPQPAVPHVGSPFSLRLQPALYSIVDVQIAASTGLSDPVDLGAPFSPAMPLFLDLQGFLGLAPTAPIGPFTWSYALDLQNLPPELIGASISFQGLGLSPGAIYLSNPLVVIPG